LDFQIIGSASAASAVEALLLLKSTTAYLGNILLAASLPLLFLHSKRYNESAEKTAA